MVRPTAVFGCTCAWTGRCAGGERVVTDFALHSRTYMHTGFADGMLQVVVEPI